MASGISHNFRWLASVPLPDQTLQAAYVDYVVRGQGEDSLLELVRHIENGSAPDFIAGIGFKRDGKLIMTPERRFGR